MTARSALFAFSDSLVIRLHFVLEGRRRVVFESGTNLVLLDENFKVLCEFNFGFAQRSKDLLYELLDLRRIALEATLSVLRCRQRFVDVLNGIVDAPVARAN